MGVTRFLRIVRTIGWYRLDEFFPRRGAGLLRWAFATAFFWRAPDPARGERLRLALEALGPVFVKFGQLLSVRRDLIPEDIADELAKLQDNVPPFPWEQVIATLDRAYGRPYTEVFRSLDSRPVASASVASPERAAPRCMAWRPSGHATAPTPAEECGRRPPLSPLAAAL